MKAVHASPTLSATQPVATPNAPAPLDAGTVSRPSDDFTRIELASEVSAAPQIIAALPKPDAAQLRATARQAINFPDFADEDAIINTFDEGHMEAIVGGLCPDVEAETGMTFRQKPEVMLFDSVEEFCDAAVSDSRVLVGLSPGHTSDKVNSGKLAIYLPSVGVLGVSPSLQGRPQAEIKSALFRELVHVIQNQTYPRYATEIHLLGAARVTARERGRDFKTQVEHINKLIQGRIAWLEGHACEATTAYEARKEQAQDFAASADVKAASQGFAPALAWSTTLTNARGMAQFVYKKCTDERPRAKGSHNAPGVTLAQAVANEELRVHRPRGSLAKQLFVEPSRVDALMTGGFSDAAPHQREALLQEAMGWAPPNQVEALIAAVYEA